jgi:hypothetical protein
MLSFLEWYNPKLSTDSHQKALLSGVIFAFDLGDLKGISGDGICNHFKPNSSFQFQFEVFA